MVERQGNYWSVIDSFLGLIFNCRRPRKISRCTNPRSVRLTAAISASYHPEKFGYLESLGKTRESMELAGNQSVWLDVELESKSY